MVTDLPIEQLKIWQENDMEHLRYEYDIKPDDLVIDLGAYQGEFAQKIRFKTGCRVIMVEPTSSITFFNDFGWCKVINKAASDGYGRIRMGGNAYWTSHELEGDQWYECFDIQEICNQKIALMKINIEGMEYNVLKRLFQNDHIKNINHLQIQFHQIDNYEILYELVSTKLSKTHKLDWRVPFIWESWSLL